MTPPITLSPSDARRIAVGAQLLGAERPTDLVATVDRLTLVQIDPTAAVAPTADLVLWSRLGGSYRPEHLRHALEHDRTLFELDATVRPMTDLPIFLAQMAVFPTRETSRAWLEANDGFRRDILARLRSDGPLLSRDLPDTAAVPWQSTGWTNDRNVTQMLEYLVLRGEVAIAGRQGKQRLWDVAERVYPAGVTAVPPDEAQRLRNARRLRSLGVAREKTTAVPVEPWDVGDSGVLATVEGTDGLWRVDPEALDRPFRGRTALLSPFDRLIHDRGRAQALFAFEYVLEMYKPEKDRRWGYYALPILHGDRLVGKLDAKTDRKAGVLRINAIHEDVPFDAPTRRSVEGEIAALAAWLGLEVG